MSLPETKLSNRRLTARLALSALAMFGFGFLLVPLYDVFCEVTGINGKTNSEAVAVPVTTIDMTRSVTVEFLTQGAAGGKWRFKPMQRKLSVHPGALHTANFEVQNLTDRNLIVQAIPSVSPGPAASYLNKTECFCFNQQPLKPGETRQLPLRFFVDTSLPDEMQLFTLSYTLFDITDKVEDPEQLFTSRLAPDVAMTEESI